MAEIFNPRKRRRDDVSSLTKRFKNLHINLDCDGRKIIFPTNQNYTGQERIDIDAAICEAECPADDEYNPELGIDQNPFYYEKNKLLHDLHAERVKRRNGSHWILAIN